jgi:Flp pilus assembly pilin Flp
MGEQVKSKLRELRTNEEGMTTAEYAVGTIAAAGLGGVLIKLLMSQEVQDLIWKIIQQAFSFLFFS